MIDQLRGLFNRNWYVSSGVPFEGDALDHYFAGGWRDGRSPHPLFDTPYYLQQLSCGLQADEDPLTHFFRYGIIRGFNPHPLFDVAHYMRNYADSLQNLDPLTHFLQNGVRDRCNPHPLFDTAFYLERHAGMSESGINPLAHYAMFGNDLRYQPHPCFQPELYASCHKISSDRNPLVDFVLRLQAASAYRAPASPECSAIILNLNKSIMTLQAVLNAIESDNVDSLELVVVDNGSNPEEFAFLASMLPQAVRLIRLQTNRFFGEGNNIGVEASRGRILLFLNNDAFVEKSTITTLLGTLDTRVDAGAAGPKFLYPDGRIQEAGAFVSACGIVTQRGKFLENQPGRFGETEPVDYVSAACLAVRRSDFEAIGGFDLVWDPAYYEDVDLCLKLRLLGRRTYYCGNSAVTHIENATSSDASLGLRLNNIVEVNREKFITRWSNYLEAQHDPGAANVQLPPPRRSQPATPLAVLFTPYSIVPGGGERYLLTIAEQLSRTHRTVVVTPEVYSSYRIRTVGRELELDLSRVELLPRSRVTEVAACDVFFAMGNEVLPQIAGMGKTKFFICQFPFPMHPNHVADAWGRLAGYDAILMYSPFAAAALQDRLDRFSGHRPKPIIVLPPPVPYHGGTLSQARVEGRILNVGRFARGGHCKRQDTLVEAFKELVARSGRTDLELHLVGTVADDAAARDYLLDVRRSAQGYPIYLHLNAPPNTLTHLYRSSSVYWHGTGYGVWETYFPERLEHFGISVIEAMSAGAVPVVCSNGGPGSIVRDGYSGFHWRTVQELVAKTMTILSSDCVEIRRAARNEALTYSPAAFDANLEKLMDDWHVQRTCPLNPTTNLREAALL